MTWLEPALTAAILAVAVAWAARRLYRSLNRRVRPGESDTCAPSAGGCGCSGCPVSGAAGDGSCDHEPGRRTSA